MPSLTLDDALRLPAFARTGPRVLTSRASLQRTIRWAHSTEQSDLVPLLRPGDLVLTMGTGLPADDDLAGFEGFATSLAEAGSSGVVVELGRRWPTQVPAALVRACDERDVPVVALTHEARFAALTEAIGERIVEGQIDELREAHRVHETFTELSFGRAEPAEILDAVRRLSGGSVVLENAQHRPLEYLAGPDEEAGFLDHWHARSTRVGVAGRTGWNAEAGWLVTRLGNAEQEWGRLVIASPTKPARRLVAVAERAAAALALHRLYARDRDSVRRRQHLELMTGLQEDPESPVVLQRCEVASFPVARRRFAGVVARPVLGAPRAVDVGELAAAAVRAAHHLRTPALVAESDGDVRVLLSCAASGDPDALVDRLGARLASQFDVVVAAGRPVEATDGVARTLLEARQVADAVPDATSKAATPRAPVVHRLDDLHLRGLLSLFGDDDRIRLFAARELEPLRRADAESQGRRGLLAALRALLTHPASKTEAAASLHLSRAAFYDRLAAVERVLGVDLDDPDTRVSLHVALVADEVSGR